MRLLDFLETEDTRRLRAVDADLGPFDDSLKRDFGERVLLVAEGKCTSEEAQLHAAGHVAQWVERFDRCAAPQKAREANTSIWPRRRQRIENRGIPNQVQHCIYADWMHAANLRRQARRFENRSVRAQGLETCKPFGTPRGSDYMRASLDRDVDSRLAERRSGAADQQHLASRQSKVPVETGPRGGVGFGESGQICPGHGGGERNYIGRRNSRVLRITPVEG